MTTQTAQQIEDRMTTYEIHPAAELFPLLDEGGLKTLTADIAQNGQLEPIAWNSKHDAEGEEV